MHPRRWMIGDGGTLWNERMSIVVRLLLALCLSQSAHMLESRRTWHTATCLHIHSDDYGFDETAEQVVVTSLHDVRIILAAPDWGSMEIA